MHLAKGCLLVDIGVWTQNPSAGSQTPPKSPAFHMTVYLSYHDGIGGLRSSGGHACELGSRYTLGHRVSAVLARGGASGD